MTVIEHKTLLKAERERCAQLCSDIEKQLLMSGGGEDDTGFWMSAGANHCAQAIRNPARE
jgi:hypothetical protein